MSAGSRGGYALGRGNTNFWSAASFGQTATGFRPRIWIMVVTAFGLSPISLKTHGTRVLHEAGRPVRLLDRLHDRVGIGGLGPLEHVGDQACTPS